VRLYSEKYHNVATDVFFLVLKFFFISILFITDPSLQAFNLVNNCTIIQCYNTSHIQNEALVYSEMVGVKRCIIVLLIQFVVALIVVSSFLIG